MGRPSQNGDYRPKARQELQRKLRVTAELEIKVAEEFDRLLSLAFEQGWTDRDIASAARMSLDAIRHARSRGGHRLAPIVCKRCHKLVKRSGRRGRPPTLCESCR